FHIGCDEAYNFDLSHTESMNAICDYINEVAEELREQGRQTIVWGDMFLYRYSHYNSKNHYYCNALGQVGNNQYPYVQGTGGTTHPYQGFLTPSYSIKGTNVSWGHHSRRYNYLFMDGHVEPLEPNGDAGDRSMAYWVANNHWKEW
ncbi:MAG: hypothetical protein J6R85_05160, partial [Lentisphaeria bacterium]|nr:hypothetical protein [Lentisphaeria bacterium]